MVERLKQSWFLVVLCLALVVGTNLGEPAASWIRRLPSEAVIALVMLSVSLATDFRNAIAGRSHWLAIGLAIAVNACAAPPLGWLCGRVLSPALGDGLVIAMSVPCTIASAIVWTRRGGGNDAAAAVVSLVTNFGCFLVLPLWTGLLLGQSAGVEAPQLMLKLLACVAAPMLVGQLARRSASVAGWADRHKAQLSLFSQSGVLLMVLLGSVGVGHALRTGQAAPSILDWSLLLAVVVMLHVALLGLAGVLGVWGRLERPELLMLMVSGSQKTMAVGLGVALDFGPLALFPLIAYHFTQLVVDTLLVERWRQQ